MDLGEYLFPLHSVKAFISDKLNVYKMNDKGLPDMDYYSGLGERAAEWVDKLDEDDDTLVSEMIYWWRKEQL
jgi:hypothetical protein